MKQIFGMAMIMSGSFAGDVHPVSSFEYEKVDGISLSMSARFPEGHQKTDKRPAIIFFHGGGWVSGHVAACTAMIEGFEEEGEDHTVSSKPNALILFSPVLDTTEKGHGSDKMIRGEKTDLSPCRQVREGLPPTVLFHGTRDTTVPPENAERFVRLMNEAGNNCVRMPFEGRRHGFFNGSGFRRNNTDEDFNTTMKKSLEFLESIGFVPEKG